MEGAEIVFVLGLVIGAVVAVFVVSVYTRKWSGEHLLRAYSLGYLEGNAHMGARKEIFPAITDAAYQENVNRAAQAALEKTVVDSFNAATSDKPPSDAR